ncbi:MULTISPECIES: NCS1 family transporter [Heyndrickxia]|jgi:NCS1 family nucleobase:cation symporter-1|uniref:Nitrate reductase n=1 Tax=Heyndrickxia oleronia TaxID=38875 RepID=A0A8E2I9C0_9BACI|nr:NCS1 family transporter [Heyndrickxia oleronia]OJH19351.1 nitrate reductase [Bacillus obstructivus]MCI1590638.1 NCS1 family transporter [Heyndrickxia oleronia]MCI1612173.1 NCS1 family transporter [Heyndrickxia oleronia]MCI1759883.1 NCS1 family transporter [Heyndrickxia oleronia]MCM3453686.1 NCS1 family transporter [Heyndrickxia oleronia]
MNNKDSYLKSPDLLPISSEERNIGPKGFAVIWVGMAVVLAAFAIGGSGVQSLPLGWVIVATLIGSVAIGIFMTIIGDIGVEHGLSFPVYMRAPFGTIGTHIPSLVRGITAACWFGLNTYFGATAMNGILNILFGFNNWFICFIVFAALQLINTALGIKAIERFADLAAPTIILISAWMYASLSDQAAEQGREIWSWVESPVTGGAAFTAFMVVVMSNMGFWATLAADMPSLSRFFKAPKNERNWFKRNKSQIVGSIIVMPIVNTFMIIIGAVSYIAVSNFDPVVALQEAASGFILGILLLMIVFAQWSTNTSANVIPAATIFSNVGGPKVPFWAAVLIAGIIGIAVQPWSLFDVIVPALLIIGGILSSIVGILFTDYYLIRKRRVNVNDLYVGNGQYKYMNGFNLAGMIAWIIGGIASYFLSSYSFIVGFLVGAVIYYILGKYWWFKKYKQAEIEDPSDEKYLGITVGRDWEILEEEEVVAVPEDLNPQI